MFLGEHTCMYYQVHGVCRQAFYILPSPSPPQPSPLLSFQLSRQTRMEMLAMQAKFLLNLWLCNFLLDKAGVPQAQAAVGARACATDQDVNKLTAKLGSGLSTGGR